MPFNKASDQAKRVLFHQLESGPCRQPVLASALGHSKRTHGLGQPIVTGRSSFQISTSPCQSQHPIPLLPDFLCSYLSSPSQVVVSGSQRGWLHLHDCYTRTGSPIKVSVRTRQWQFETCMDDRLISPLLQKFQWSYTLHHSSQID